MSHKTASPQNTINEADMAAALGSGIDISKFAVFPGFADVHVHLREPGFVYKETIKSGTMAAARGGYTRVLTMPNLNPVPDCLDTLRPQLDAISRDAVVNVSPYGAITVGEKGEKLAALEEMAPYVAAFSDDGRGVQSRDMMRSAMFEAKWLDKIVAAHCEDNSLLHGGCIHEGRYARKNGFVGISSESEYAQIARDVELAAEVGCKYHVCHVSARESVDIIRKAKARGVDVTCETAPHYLVLCDDDLRDEGRFKMNPPLRDASDRAALIVGILDGTIDMIATDHAPHSAEEKSKGLKGSLMGVVGLETAFPVLYTELVKTEVLTLDALVDLLTVKPRRRFGLPMSEGLCVWDLDAEYTVDPSEFATMGRATPFEGRKVFGRCVMTVLNGKIVYRDGRY